MRKSRSASTVRRAAAFGLLLALPATAAPWVFEGRLVPPDGRTADAYTVVLEHHEGRRQTPPSDFRIAQPPDADGAFRIAAEPHPGQYWLFVQDGNGRVLIGYPHLNASRDFEAIELRDDGEVMGALQTPEGEPAAGVTVHIERRLDAPCRHYVDAGSVRSDAEGHFAITALHPGDHRLRIESERYAHAAMDVAVTGDLTYLDLQLEPAASIRGRVTLADGTPVGGVSVQVDPQVPPAVTDADGRYRVRGLRANTYRLRAWGDTVAVEHYGTLSVAVDAEEVTAPDILVAPVGSLRVSLARETPGEPLPERLPIVLEARGDHRGWFRFDAPVRDGVATFENLAPGRFVLRLQRDELGDVRADVEIRSEGVTDVALALPEVLVLHGQVLEASGDPLPGARVMYRSAPPADPMAAPDRFDDLVHRHARSDAAGRFRLAGLPAGEGTLTIQAEDRVTLHQSITLPADGDAVYTLETGRSVSLRIVDEDGAPLAGARLLLATDVSRRDPMQPRDTVRGESDAEGRVVLRALTAGRYRLSVDADDHYGHFDPVEITDETERLDDLVMTRGLEITGTVSEADGAPVAGARVGAMMQRPARGMPWMERDAETDAEGAFRIGGLPEGVYRLGVRDARTFEELSTVPDVPAGSEDLVVILAERHTIPLRVLGPDGRPAAGAEFSVQPTGPHRTIRSLRDERQTTDAEGRASITVRGGARYAIAVRRRPWVDATHPLDLTAGREAPASIEIRMKAGRSVSGTVVNADGAPRAGAFVTAGDRTPVRTDAQGAFEIPGIGPGVLALRVHTDPEGERLIGARTVVVDPAAESVPPVRIVLPEPGSVRGTLRDAEGAPIPGTDVMLNSLSDRTDLQAMYRSETDDEGAFAFDSVMPGRYLLIASAVAREHPADGPRTPMMRVVEVAAGEAVVADLPEATAPTQAVSGRVTRDGAPVTDARVLFVPRGEDGRTDVRAVTGMMGWEPAVTGPEGRYSADALEPGRYIVMIVQEEDADAGAEAFHYGVPVEIEAGQTELDIAVEGVTLRGIALRSSGEPTPGAAVIALPVASGTDSMSRRLMARSAETGEDGRFELPYLASGPLRITVIDEAGGEAITSTLEASADETPEHRIRLMPGLRIAGRVRREPEGALERSIVLVLSPDGAILSGARVDEEGRFAVEEVLPRDRYLVACLHPELAAVAQAVGADADGELTFLLRPGGGVAVSLTGPPERIAGRALEIVDASGNRVPHLATLPDLGYLGEMTRSLSLLPTDVGGRTRADGLPAGDYTVRLADADVQAAVTVRPFEDVAVELAVE